MLHFPELRDDLTQNKQMFVLFLPGIIVIGTYFLVCIIVNLFY
jgi:hypothetical protein